MLKTIYPILILLLSVFSISVYGQKPLSKPVRPHKTVNNPKPSKRSYTITSSVNGSHRVPNYVDLGLPSDLKWATCNLGASSPEEYGSYYAWGEISHKSDYSSENNITFNKKLGDISGRSQYDAARYIWGGNWRIPTKQDIDELTRYCDYKKTIYKGVKGGLFTSKKNGRKLFIPAAGYISGTSLYYVGESGYYWSSTPNEDNDYYACYLNFNDYGNYWVSGTTATMGVVSDRFQNSITFDLFNLFSSGICSPRLYLAFGRI